MCEFLSCSKLPLGQLCPRLDLIGLFTRTLCGLVHLARGDFHVASYLTLGSFFPKLHDKIVRSCFVDIVLLAVPSLSSAIEDEIELFAIGPVEDLGHELFGKLAMEFSPNQSRDWLLLNVAELTIPCCVGLNEMIFEISSFTFWTETSKLRQYLINKTDLRSEVVFDNVEGEEATNVAL